MRALWVMVFLCLLSLSQQVWALDAVGKVVAVRGLVTHMTPSSEDFSDVTIGDAIYMDSVIMTGPTGRAQVVFDDDSVYTIGKNSEIVVDTFVYDPVTHDGESNIEATSGIFKFVTGKIAKKDPKKVKINTPFATIGVRGSGGVVEILPNGQTMLGMTECCLDIAARGSSDFKQLNTVGTYSMVQSQGEEPTDPVVMPDDMIQQMGNDLGEKIEMKVPEKEVDASAKQARKKPEEAQKNKQQKQTAQTRLNNFENSRGSVERQQISENKNAVDSVQEVIRKNKVVDEVSDDNGDILSLGTRAQRLLSNQPVKSSVSGRKTTGTSYGYIAGHVLKSGQSGVVTIDSGESVDDFRIIRKADGSISVLAEVSAQTGKVYEVIAGADSVGESVYVKDDVYYAEVDSIKHDGGIVNLLNDGYFISRRGTSNATIAELPDCGTCKFASWGAWIADFNDPSLGSISVSDPLDKARFVPFVVGELAPTSVLNNLQSQGITANYAGVTVGTLSNGSTLETASGKFNAGVDFGTRSVVLNDFNFGNYSLSTDAIGSFTSGSSSFNLTGGVTNGTYSGSLEVNGAFFGGSASQLPDIGGSFGFNASGVSGQGVFAGNAQ